MYTTRKPKSDDNVMAPAPIKTRKKQPDVPVGGKMKNPKDRSREKEKQELRNLLDPE